MRLFALIDREELGFTTYSFFAALVFFALILFDNKVHSENDLTTRSGFIESYTFENGSRGTKYYSIRLKDLTPGFKLPADFIDYFDLGSFYGEVEGGRFLHFI